jgi:hypothetical protein
MSWIGPAARPESDAWRVVGHLRPFVTAAVAVGFAGITYRLVVTGALTLDVGWGRTLQSLGPLRVSVAAPRQVVYDVISQPYLGRTPHAMADKLEVQERGSDMTLAAHHTPTTAGLTATTLETVRFTAPDRIEFRLVRGPVPHVRESFLLHETERGTELEYAGELGVDFWALGRWWGKQVARKWEAAVADSLASINTEAERRAALHGPRSGLRKLPVFPDTRSASGFGTSSSDGEEG